MKTSESIAKIAPALLKAQEQISAVVKDKVGKVQTKTGRDYEYKYSDLASVIEQVKPALNAAGIVFLQSPSQAEGGVIVATRLLHSSGEFIEGDTFIPCTIASAQAFGSAITYGKRYGLQSLVGLPSEDDDGDAAGNHKGNGKARPEAATTVLPNADKHTAKQAAQDALDCFPPEEQAFLQQEAIKIIAMAERGEDTYAYTLAANYDTEEKLALWALLPSNVRNGIKKQQRAAELPMQP